MTDLSLIPQNRISDLSTSFSSKADDSTVVKLTGDQTIAGSKTFNTAYTSFKGTAIDITNAKTTLNDVGINWLDKNGTVLGQNHIRTDTAGSIQNNMYIKAHNSNNWARISIGYDANDNVYTYAPTPTADNTTTTQIDTVGARNTKLNSLLESIYPVGSVYIGTMSTCPMASLISGSTWTLVSSGRVLQGADNDHAAGTTIAAGLPNITGTVGYFIHEATDQSTPVSSGAFSTKVFDTTVANSGSGNKSYEIDFDASKSNSIYGKSSKVQPLAYVVNIWQRTA